MNKYRVQKIVYANSVGEADDIVTGGETSFIELVEDEKKNKVGFYNRDNE